MEVKIPFYNILNMFLTGLVFVGGYAMIDPDFAVDILSSDMLKTVGSIPEILMVVGVFAAAYEIGLIINRIGSVIVGEILIRMKLISYDNDYLRYNVQKKKFPIMSTLSREYALSRTGVTLFIILTGLAVYRARMFLVWIFGFIVVVYFLSLKKYSEKIIVLMKDYSDEASDDCKE